MTAAEADFRRLPDVASRGLGGSVMATNDDFFADVHSLITARPGTARPAGLRTAGQGLRRLGDPPPPRRRVTTS